MKTKLILSLILSLALLVFVSPVSVYAIPTLPHTFYGDVEINGSPAPDGTQISATVDVGDIVPIQNPVSTVGGSFGITSPKLLVQGDGLSGNITFYVTNENGTAIVGETYPFEIGGGPTPLVLSVTIPPTIAYSPSSLSFAATAGGANPPSQTLSISNCGVNPTAMDWSVSDDAAWLSHSPASGISSGEVDSVTVSVSISGMSAGDYNATITISAPGATNTPQATSVSLHISTAPEPNISVSPMSKNFGNVTVGSSSSPQTVTVSNVGTANLLVGTITIAGANADQFTIQNDNCSGKTITLNGSATLQVVFSPTSTGAKSATLEILSNDPDEAIEVSLSGTGVTAVSAPPPTYYTETNLFGTEESFRISSSGKILETIEATSADGNLTITIPKDTIALDKDGKRLKSLEAAVDETPPDPPEDAHIIGLAYDFGPDGATFDPEITLEYSYDPADIPEGIADEDLVIAYYDEAIGEWVVLEGCVVDTENNTITALVSHFTTFAIIGAVTPVEEEIVLPPPPILAPAAFSLTDLSVKPVEVLTGEAVTITVPVANTGGTEGSYTVVLKINGVKEAEKSVTIAAGSSEMVTFSVTKKEVGSYTVTIDGLSASFAVVAVEEVKEVEVVPIPTPGVSWPLIGGLIVAAIVIGLFVFAWLKRRAYR